MTLIAYAARKTHADLLTDTISYTSGFEEFGHCTKFNYLAHLDAVVMTQGSLDFGHAVDYLAQQISGDAPSFNSLVADISNVLPDLWAEHTVKDPEAEMSVHLVGYSPQSERFEAFRCHAEHEFVPEPTPSGELYTHPTPWDAKPDHVERDRVRGFLMEAGWEAAKADDLMARWDAMPTTPAPTSVDQWRDLGKRIRTARALEQFVKVAVAGSLVHCRLELGAFASRTVHRFNDRGEEFLKLVAGTCHPLALGSDAGVASSA